MAERSNPASNARDAAAAAPVGPPRHGGVPGRGGKVEKPKNTRATLRRLWTYAQGEKRGFAVIFAAILCGSALALLAPYLIGEGIDAIGKEAGDVRFGLLQAILAALAVAYVADAALTLLHSWLMAGVSQRIVFRLRRSLFGKLQKLPLAYFDARPHGEMMSRLSNDVDNVSNAIGQTATQFMAGIIAVLGSLAFMLALSPILTLAALITVPLVYGLARTITRRTGALFREQQARLGELNGHVEETVSGLEVVKAFNHEAESVRRFESVNGQLLAASLKAQIWSGFLMPLLSVISNLGFASIAVVGGWLAVRGEITVGVIASFLGYSRQFVRPLNEIANMFNVLQSGLAGAERVFEVLDDAEEPGDAPNAVPLTNPNGHVRFERVGFGYRPDVPILRDVSFEAMPGTGTALVGPTGAGKTTIVNLLTRFYDVTEGRILIDGRDVREYTRDSLRSCFGIVLQDTYLFSGTIQDNIKYGKPDATDEEVRKAAKLANADEFIRRLPRGYETVLSESGSNLSQGQRQLLAIARVILAKPAMLILDEATSSIDTRTELHIQDALLQLMQGRTTFLIAHRLNTIRDADSIMVMERGQVVEQGSHDELYRGKGRYYELFMHQFKNLQEA